MAKLKIKIDKDREIFVKVNLFEDDDEINIDKILKVDYQNLICEILTFPAILNKFGILLADTESNVKEAELDYRIWKAKKREEIRNDFEEDEDRPVKRGGYKYTVDEVDDAMRKNPVYNAKNKKINKTIKTRDYMNSIYWSAKSKADKLEKLSLTIRPDEINFDDLVDNFNGVEIRVKKPLIN